MGAQRILQAAGLIVVPVVVPVVVSVVVAVVCASVGSATAAPVRQHERVAVIDLGPDATDGSVRQRIIAAVVAAGFDAVIGDNVEDALAGHSVDRDALDLAVAIERAQRAFGAFDCATAIEASTQAAALAAMRQAAGLPAPELARAYTYLLSCKDKAGDVDGAMVAAARLRAVVGPQPKDVPAEVWRKYPDVDTIVDRELVELEITTDVPDATVWIDHRPAGTAPLRVQLPAGDHLIAVAAGTRRGWAAGHTDPRQHQLAIPTRDRAGTTSAIAARVAGWKGALPSPVELGRVMTSVRVRVVLIRHGDTVEAWGRIGRAEPVLPRPASPAAPSAPPPGAPYRLGGDDGIATLDDVPRLLALVADRVQTWSDRAPDPDRPLLVESATERARDRRDGPTKWWVYASLGAALVAAGAVLYVHEAGSERQRVELTFPKSQDLGPRVTP